MRDRDIAARWLWLLPLAAAVIANLPSVSGELVWDDEFWTRQLAWFTSLAAVLKPPAGIPDWPEGYFRPVTTLSYLLDAQLYGAASVAGRHVSNIAFHAITTLGVWRLARRLLTGRPGERAAAAFAATVFAVHPIHTESVGWIGARVDILATMFLVASVLLALAWRDRPLAGRSVGRSVAALLLAPAAYAAALGSKEVAITGLALVPLALLLAPPAGACAGQGSGNNLGQDQGEKGRAPGTWIPLAILFVAVTWGYLVLRREAAGAFEPQLISGAPWYLTRAAAYYVTKLLVPWPQSNFVVWDMLPGMPASIGILLGASALTASAAVFYTRRGNAMPLLGLLWAGAALAPSFVLAVTTTAAAPVAERYLYLPSVGMVLALGALVSAFSATRWRRPAILALSVVVAAYLGGSIARSLDWSSNIRLWTATARQVTTHGLPWVELARAYYARNDYESALRAYERARGLENNPGAVAVAEYNMGVIYLKREALDEAERAFLRSRGAFRDYPLAHYGLGRIYYERGLKAGPAAGRLDLFANAQREFVETIHLSPGFGEPRLQIARVLLRQGDVLGEAGQTAEAAESYRAGLAQLDMLIRAMPSLPSQPGITELRAELARKALADECTQLIIPPVGACSEPGQ